MTSSRLEKLVNEKIEGLPDTFDPYVGRNAGAPTPEGAPEESTEGLSQEMEGLMEPPAPQRPTWSPLAELPGVWAKYTNAKDQMFQRSDGFVLRMRELQSVPGRFAAQLIKGEEVLDKGFVDVEEGVDPVEMIQKMADQMLDDKSERFAPEEAEQQQSQGMYADEAPMEGEPSEEAPEVEVQGEEPEMDLEDLGLDEIQPSA